jgi:hypothetical protein
MKTPSSQEFCGLGQILRSETVPQVEFPVPLQGDEASVADEG